MASRRSARLSATASSNKVTETEPAPPPVESRKRKTREIAGDSSPTDPAPSTPRKKRSQASTQPPPVTPTPSAVGLINERADATVQKPRSKAVARLADPEKTNAPLVSPETCRIVSSKHVDDISPSKASNIKTTTSTLLEEACEHLIKVYPNMKPLIAKNHCRIFSPEGLAEKIDPFESLASSIISQQVSGAAAKAIKARFIALFNNDDAEDKRFPHPSQVAVALTERLRTAGLSQRKAEYVRGLAEKFASGELSAQMLADADYGEVLEKLIAVRGLGQWSVEMFACFGLKRMDVFSLGDLGVQRGMAAFVGRDVAKLKAKGGKWKYMSEKEMQEISEPARPYRSVFMWYMWRVEETDISTLE